ncbi:Importin-13 [Folsomia candida]|uniref:Importin-13 n=1 Tax=Folsomia candida TaxID=158441 RepID=A0A226DCC5_FOLCA|nr:Importin-13 [Folsomia candida]
MEFTPENVEAAVLEFYNNTGKVNKEVHEWLKQCQSSREAWQVVWPLLDPGKSLQLQFLAANILHYKVSRCFGELPEPEYAGLKDRLVAIVAKYIAGPPMVLTRLCLTLGAFVLNTIGTVWMNPLDDLASTFAPQNFPGVPEVTVLRLLVQVFGHIPEQAFSLSSVAKGQALYSWLFNVAQNKTDNRELVLEIYKALNSWMKMICIFEWPELFQFVDLLCNSVVTYVDLNDGDVGDIVIEILSGIVGEPQAHQYPTIILKLLDKEMANAFYGMYVALGECHSKLIVDVADPECSYSLATRWPEIESLLLGIKAVSENISDETDPVVAAPMSRVFTVIYRVLKLNRDNKSPTAKNPKLFQAAIECISSCSGMLHLYDAVVKNIVGFILEASIGKWEFDAERLQQNSILHWTISAPNPEVKPQLVGLLNVFSTLCLSLDGSSSSDEEDDDGEEVDLDAGGVPLNNNNSSHQHHPPPATLMTAGPPTNLGTGGPPRAQPLIPVVEQILPVLIPVAEKWARDEDAIEALFSIVKHTLSTIQSSSMTVLQYAMQLVIISFKLNPLTSATHVAKQTLLMLGKENRAVQQQFLSEMHVSCADRLKDMRDTEFTESYFQLLGQLMKSDCDLPARNKHGEGVDIFDNDGAGQSSNSGSFQGGLLSKQWAKNSAKNSARYWIFGTEIALSTLWRIDPLCEPMFSGRLAKMVVGMFRR